MNCAMRRTGFIFAVLAIAGLVCWLVPPFHLVPLQQAQKNEAQKVFDPATYAQKFWCERLLPNSAQAADAAAVVTALTQDSAAAAKKYGRTVGLSDTVFYFLGGTGVVVSADAKGVALSLVGPNQPADVLLKTGLVFGDTVRDATGLLDVNEFANSQDFNAVSTELNHLVETTIVPELKKARAGDRLHFVAAAEVEADSDFKKPLKAIPLAVKFE